MDAAERRNAIREALENSDKAVSAGSFARKFGVSRQVIVGDVALLRAANVPISATPRGYVLQTRNPQGLLRTVACRHSGEGIARELYAAVDNGCAVLDVIVDHPVYGQISGQLQVFSRYDADDFMRRLLTSGAQPLSNLTEGVHLHTLLCPSEEAYRRVLNELKSAGILFEKETE